MNADRLIQSLLTDLPALLPEAAIVFLFLISLIQALFFKSKATTVTWGKIYALALLFIAILIAYQCNCRFGSYFWEGWQVDQASIQFAVLIVATTGLVWFFAPKEDSNGTYFPLILIGFVMGALFLAYASHLLTAYLALELLSLSSYLILLHPAGLKIPVEEQSEAALKFFIQGATSSAMMLFGFSIMFAFSGSLHYSSLLQVIMQSSNPLLLTGFLLSLAGFLFKLSMWPLHWWAPDVYQSGNTTVILLFSTVSKIAGIAAAYRYLHSGPMEGWVQVWLALFAVVVMTLGNFGAFRALNFRRMMAFSSVSQSGFLWLALILATTGDSLKILVFYLISVVLGKWLAWAVYQRLEPALGAEMTTWSFQRSSGLFDGLMLLVAFMSLTGLPLTMGFFAKFFLFTELFEYLNGPQAGLWWWVLAGSVVNTLPALFYYLRPFYFGFIKNEGSQSQLSDSPWTVKSLWLVLALAILLFFFFPGVWF